ncbi:hypothetical protein [Streptomyces oceani]|nr:hypothetical protein [Streptomyces oceani]
MVSQKTLVAGYSLAMLTVVLRRLADTNVDDPERKVRLSFLG